MNPRRVIGKVVSLPLMVAALCAVPLIAQNTTPAAGPVCSGTWSSPFPVQRSGGRPVYIERGVLAPFGNTMLALGAPTFFWLAPDHMAPPQMMLQDTAQAIWAFTRSGASFDLAGTADGTPLIDLNRRRSKPRLLGSSDSTMQVLWQGIDSVAPLASAGEPNRVEVATFDGRAWSEPQVIFRSRYLRDIAVPAMRAGTAFLSSVVGFVVTDSGARVHVLRRSGSQWMATNFRTPSSAHHAIAARASDNSTIVVYSATIPGEGTPNGDGSRTHPSGIYSARIEWRGDSAIWSPSQLIDTIQTTGGFRQFDAARLGADTLVVMWYQSTADAADRHLTTVVTTNAGRSWNPTPRIPVDGSVSLQRLAVDSHGRLHVVFSRARIDALGSPGSTMHALWQSGAWSTPTRIAEDEAGLPSASGTKDGRIIAMWTETLALAGGVIPKSMFSIWSPGPNCGQ